MFIAFSVNISLITTIYCIHFFYSLYISSIPLFTPYLYFRHYSIFQTPYLPHVLILPPFSLTRTLGISERDLRLLIDSLQFIDFGARNLSSIVDQLKLRDLVHSTEDFSFIDLVSSISHLFTILDNGLELWGGGVVAVVGLWQWWGGGSGGVMEWWGYDSGGAVGVVRWW